LSVLGHLFGGVQLYFPSVMLC